MLACSSVWCSVHAAESRTWQPYVLLKLQNSSTPGSGADLTYAALVVPWTVVVSGDPKARASAPPVFPQIGLESGAWGSLARFLTATNSITEPHDLARDIPP